MDHEPNKPKHNHGEAFMVMTYACKAGHRLEIWNSRDGTPDEARAILRKRLKHLPREQYGYIYRDKTGRELTDGEVVERGIQEHHEFQPGWPMLDQVPLEQPAAVDPDPTPPTLVLWASSGYGVKTRKPFVTIHWKDVVEQLSPADARRFALSIIEAAEAADQDAFLFEWVKQVTGIDDAGATRLLIEYREWRAKHEEHPDGV